MRERVGAWRAALRVTALTGLCVFAALGRGGCAGRPTETGPSVVTEPALFVGVVELTGDPERGFGVLLSTATEEVLVADSAAGRRLARYEGEVVAAFGRLLESARGPSTIVVREFRVLGTETRERAAAADMLRVSAPPAAGR